MPVWPLPQITFRELSSIEEKRPVALLVDPEVWAVLSSQLNLPVLIQANPEDCSRDLFDYLAQHLPSHVKAIYAVGQGAPVQAGKIIAARNHVPLVIVPTALENSDILSPVAWVEDEEDGTTHLVQEEPGPATEVIIDWGIIESAPEAQRGAGIVDVLSIVSGLLDWRYAAQKGKNLSAERFAPWAATVAAGLASQAIKSAAAIGQGNRESLHILLNLMMMAVQLSNQLEHTRATEGSEHYLAQILASEITDPLPHSQIVGPCLLFVSALHGQSPTALREAMEAAGVPLDNLRATDLRLTLDKLAEYLDWYGFPFSILDDTDPASELVDQALEAAGLAIKEDTWQKPEDTQPAITEAIPLQEENHPTESANG